MQRYRPEAPRVMGATTGWLRHPYVVLASALVLPGSGQVINGNPVRGLIMLFYIILLGIVTAQFAGTGHSILGRYAGGWFIYAVAAFDAYRTARYRWEYRRQYGREVREKMTE